MEQNEISLHEIKIYRALHDRPEQWLTNDEILQLVGDMSGRTVRAKTSKFVALGMVDVAEVFPAHRYRWSKKAKQRNAAYLQRLQHADEVFHG